MSSSIDQFNSELLKRVKANYAGIFTQKMLEAQSVQNWEKDLGWSCSLMFKKVTLPVSPPTQAMFQNYGKGSVGNDSVINIFLDNIITQLIETVRNKKPPSEDLSYSLNTIQEMPLPELNNMNEYLTRYLTIIKGMGKVWNSSDQELPPITVTNQEDVSFLWVCGLLNQLVLKKFQFNDIIQFHVAQPQIKPSSSWTLFNRKPKGSLFFPENTFLNLAENLKKDNTLQGRKANLPSSLSHLLASSASLWNSDAFSLDETSILSMTTGEREALMQKNKLSLLEQCFEYLASDTPWDTEYIGLNEMRGPIPSSDTQQFQQKIRNSMGNFIELGADIERQLLKIEQVKQILTNAIESNRKIYKTLEKLLRTFYDFPEEDDLNQVMDNILLRQQYPENLDRLIIEEVSKYRQGQSFIELQRDILQNLEDQLEAFRESYKTGYLKIADEYFSLAKRLRISLNRLLEVHTVFSYFIFNQELFPVPEYQHAKDRRARMQGLIYKEGKPQKSYFKFQLQNRIDLFLTNHTQVIFRRFRDPEEQTIEPIDQNTIHKINSVIKWIKRSPDNRANFIKLDKSIYNFLLEDQAFSQMYQSLEEADGNLVDTAKEQSFVQAALLLSEGTLSESSLGIRRPIGFLRMHNTALHYLEEDIRSDVSEDSSLQEMPSKSLVAANAMMEDLKKFRYPKKVVQSFQDNIQFIYEKVPANEMAYIEERLNPIEIDQFPHIREKKAILAEIKNKILTLNTPGQGTYNLSKELDSFQEVEEILDPAYMVEQIFPKNPYIQKRLTAIFANKEISIPDMVNSLREFVLREKLSTNIFSKRNWLDRFKKFVGLQQRNNRYILLLAALHEELKNQLDLQTNALEKIHTIDLSANMRGEQANLASIFDQQTLFQKYKEGEDTIQKHQEEADQLADITLPLLVGSYMSDLNHLTKLNAEQLKDAKIEALESQFPGATASLQSIRSGNAIPDRKLQELNSFLQAFDLQRDAITESKFNRLKRSFPMAINLIADAEHATKANPALFQEISKQMNKGLSDQDFKANSLFSHKLEQLIKRKVENNKSGSIAAAVSLIAFISKTNRSISDSLIFSAFIGLFWQKKVQPSVTEYLQLFAKNFSHMTGKEYAHGNINKYILEIFKTSLETEVRVADATAYENNEKIEPQTAFLHGLFLQEIFSLLDNAETSILALRSRLNMLLPESLEAANMSVQFLNLFFRINRDLFFNVPPELLQNLGRDGALNAVQEYAQAYNSKISTIEKQFLDQSGREEEDADLDIGSDSPLKLHLKQMAREGKLNLSFLPGSFVYETLSRGRTYRDMQEISLPILEDQIVPIGSQHVEHLETFFNIVQQIKESGLKRQLTPSLSIIMKKIDPMLKLSPEHTQTFKDLLRASYLSLRMGLDTANRLDQLRDTSVASYPSDFWLTSTNATGVQTLSSPLFREAYMMLSKTLELATSSGLLETDQGLRALSEIGQHTGNYLQGKPLKTIAFSKLQHLETDLKMIISNMQNNPSVIFPILLESEKNQIAQYLSIVWKDNPAENIILGEIPESARFQYITGNGLQLFYTSERLRGMALTPMISTALELSLMNNSRQVAGQFLEKKSRLAFQRQQQFSNTRQALQQRIDKFRGNIPQIQGFEPLQKLGLEDKSYVDDSQTTTSQIPEVDQTLPSLSGSNIIPGQGNLEGQTGERNLLEQETIPNQNIGESITGNVAQSRSKIVPMSDAQGNPLFTFIPGADQETGQRTGQEVATQVGQTEEQTANKNILVQSEAGGGSFSSSSSLVGDVGEPADVQEGNQFMLGNMARDADKYKTPPQISLGKTPNDFYNPPVGGENYSQRLNADPDATTSPWYKDPATIGVGVGMSMLLGSMYKNSKSKNKGK